MRIRKCFVETSAKITKSLRKEDIDKKWWVVDAAGQVVGRLASQVAAILRGKHKPDFTPHNDCGDFVIILNADKVKLTGKRPDKKEYKHHSLYPGGQKIEKYKMVLDKKPSFILEHAIKGMLPKNKLGRKIGKNLKVYAGESHPHTAQMPEIMQCKYN
ncbi:MAG: 50S ribosomal protein L13 [Bacteroidetes bacterium]|nr:50S ribosomal protein L13 [Bacteroidota bacterium]